jgi:hypothetical protein
MDPASLALPPVPAPAQVAEVAGGAVLVPTSGLPLILPMAGLTPTVLADLAARSERLAVDQRVGLLLAGGRRTEAFALATRDPRPLAAQGRLDLELASWAASEMARLSLPATRAPVLVVGDDTRNQASGDLRGAWSDVRDLLPLAWPRWAGPVVIYLDTAPRGIPAEGVVRPALPLLQVPPGPDLRAAAAAKLALLALDLSAAPTSGWPTWLRRGVAETARARAAGEGPSPRAMKDRLKTAGSAAIAALWTGDEPDAKLAGAVVALQLQPQRREQFATFLAFVRGGATSSGALLTTYGALPDAW